MKKIILFLITIMVTIIFSQNVFAAITYPTLDRKNKVHDNIDVFTTDQLDSLTKQAKKLSKELSMDIVIVIDNQYYQDNIEKLANDTFTNNNFGTEFENKSGILIYIDKNSNNIGIYTNGNAMYQFPYSITDTYISSVLTHINTKHYYTACETILNLIAKGGVSEKKEFKPILFSLPGLIISILITLFATYILYNQRNIKLIKKQQNFIKSFDVIDNDKIIDTKTDKIRNNK